MGGRGYHNDVKGYLTSDKRTAEYSKISELSTDEIDFIQDRISERSPVTPEFSNSPNKIYVLLNKERTGIKSITKYDSNHEQSYSIHLDHAHNGLMPHVQSGLNSGRVLMEFTQDHKDLVDKITDRFNNWRKKL